MPNGPELVPAPALPIDAELAARVAKGDSEAMTALVQRYTRAVMTVLQKRLRQTELALDLTQETFLIVFERLRGDGIDDPDRLAGFLRQTAINLAIGEQRKLNRRRTESDNQSIASAIDETAGPAAQLEREQAGGMVRRLIGELPMQRDRELLWRYYVLGHDKDRLCRDFSLGVEHFDRVLHRARGRLRELVEKNHGAL
ncbi:RNA polymerase sigma factor (sigma-70 family) [Tahibacter aquaticus]|uniref:RNA polymerase sigma factor (Sigma-70 family) n=2 Tax=Tahibacter aquaticus TaxID=520092 RepID=A0A4V3DLV9_9GAMM|nr:RNA polymerase sigma factor (sigma-70 family) [Tahibacter aquaticus]